MLKKNIPPWLREVLLLRGTDLYQDPKYDGLVENPPKWRMPFPQKKGYTGVPSWLQQAQEVGNPLGNPLSQEIMPDPEMETPMDDIPQPLKPSKGPIKRYYPMR